MTPRVLLLVAVATCVGPTRSLQAMTPQQEKAIKADVAQVFNKFVAACEQVDFEAVMALEADVPDFLYADTDGSMYDHQGFRKLVAESFSGSRSLRIITQRERTIVLAADAALYSWNGAVEMKPKSGKTLRTEPFSATFVMRKLANGWRIIYQHESARMPSDDATSSPGKQ